MGIGTGFQAKQQTHRCTWGIVTVWNYRVESAFLVYAPCMTDVTAWIGSISAAVAATGTVGTLTTAIWTQRRYGRDLMELQAKQLRAEQAEKRWREANSVRFTELQPDPEWGPWSRLDTTETRVFEIAKDGDPITDVTVDMGGPSVAINRIMLSNGQESTDVTLGFLDGGTVAWFIAPAVGMHLLKPCLPVLTFVDRSGTRWKRPLNGPLEETGGEPTPP